MFTRLEGMFSCLLAGQTIEPKGFSAGAADSPRKPGRNQVRLLAAVAAVALPMAARAVVPTPYFQVTPGDFNTTTGVLTPDYAPAGLTGMLSGTVAVATNATPSGASAFAFSGAGDFQLSSALNSTNGLFTIFAVTLPSSDNSQPKTFLAGDRGSLQYRIDNGVNAGDPALLSRAVFQFGNASVAADTSKYSVLSVTNAPGVGRPNGVIFTNNGTNVGDNGADGQNLGSITRFGGAQNGGTDNELFNGQIAELLVFNTNLSTADRQSVSDQLASTFGISSNNFKWTGTTGPYSTPTNWNPNGVPNDVNLHQATINNGGTAQIVSSDSIGLKNFYIGDTIGGGSTGNVAQSGGSLTVSNQFVIGNNQGQGNYIMTGGSLTYSGGTNFGPAGLNTLAPSVLDLSGNAAVSLTGTGVATIGQGTTASTGSGNGVLNLSGNASFTVASTSQFIVGNDGTGTVGVVNMNGGTLTSNSWLTIGREAATGIVNLSGGTITKAVTSTGGPTPGFFSFGSSNNGGNGTLNQTGGTVNNLGSATWLGEQPGSTGTWNISAGTANVQVVNVGLSGAGTLNISGTAVFNATAVAVTSGASSSGIVNLNPGGLLTIASMSRGGGTTAVVNLNGGTLQASGDASPFVYGFQSGELRALAGGAVIDSNGHTISVTAPISSPTGVIGGLTKVGAGTLQVSGVNTYTGSTTVSAGTLQLKAPSTPVTVPNFSFETPSVTGPGYVYNPTGASWTFTGQAGITNGGGFNINGAPPDGTQVAYVQGSGTVAQAINFPTTGNYTIGFFSEQRSGGNDNYQQISLTVDGTDLTGGGIQPGATFAQSTYVVSETAGSHTLSFNGINFLGGDNTALVDDVTVAGNFGTTASTAIPATSPVIIAGGATFDINGALQSIGSLVGPSTASVTLGAGSLSVNTVTASEFDGVISGTGTLTVGGTNAFTLGGSNTYSGDTTVNAGGILNVTGSLAATGNLNANGTVNFGPASTSATTILTRMKNNINVGTTGVVTIAPAATHATRTLLIANSINFASTTTGTFDLANNDAELTGQSLAAVTQLVANGYNSAGGGNFQGGGGITSSTAAADSTHLTALGVIQNNQGPSGTPIYTSANPFAGNTAVGASDVLVKYTYFGDANLDGKVDGSDYSLIDNSSNLEKTSPGLQISGWFNGDFNYDGVVDGSDYTLIDNAFNTQRGQITTATSLVAGFADLVAAPVASAVPEPAFLGLLIVGAAALSSRRRRLH